MKVEVFITSNSLDNNATELYIWWENAIPARICTISNISLKTPIHRKCKMLNTLKRTDTLTSNSNTFSLLSAFHFCSTFPLTPGPLLRALNHLMFSWYTFPLPWPSCEPGRGRGGLESVQNVDNWSREKQCASFGMGRDFWCRGEGVEKGAGWRGEGC